MRKKNLLPAAAAVLLTCGLVLSACSSGGAKEAETVSSYIVVRKGTKEYYSGNEEMSGRFFSRLPAYGFESQDSNSGFYYNDMQKLVKQIDFVFSDGEEGSLFLVTRVSSVISKTFLVYLFSAIVLILVLTSIVLTQWVYKSFFEPINRLNVAMQQIAETGLRLYFTSALFMGYNVILSTYFTSVENAVPAHVVSLLRGLIVIVPAAFLMSAAFLNVSDCDIPPFFQCV